MDELRSRGIEPQHVRLIERASARFYADPNVVALLVGGSVAHGYARSDSDVDVIIVVRDDSGPRTMADDTLADYDGGYLDGKLVTREFVAEVAERGSEPARWAFRDAIVAFSHDPELPALVERAATYPLAERDERLRTFVAYLPLLVWFAGEAEKRADRYLASYASSRAALFAGRAILAFNAQLYPFHKWFLRELEAAPQKPERLLELIDGALVEQTRANVEALASAVTDFCGLELSIRESADTFVELTEWGWRDGRPAPEDL